MFAGLSINLLHIMRTQPAQVASTQSSRTVTVGTTRGTIYDCHQQPIVNDEHAYYASIAPEESLLTAVRPAVNDTTFSRLREQLRSGIPAGIRLNCPIGITQGLMLFRLPMRYGERLLAPHVIGYLDNSQQEGVAGIERACNKILAQYTGKATVRYAVDGTGRCLTGVSPTVENDTSRSVGGVVLTIDKEIQTIVEDIAPKHLQKGAVVVMDPYTGAIRAMASFPMYQPDTVAQSIDAEDGALLNRAMVLYDCGSVFKIVTAAAALEAGTSMRQEYNCTGSMAVQNNNFHCHNRLGHQRLDMSAAFAQSCNPYFIQLAQHTGAEKLQSMANAFGFGRSITLVEGFTTAVPILPSIIELRSSDAALANLSFGQGKLMITPLHITSIVAAVVNDGKMPSPQLIQGYMDENHQYTENRAGEALSVISSDTAKKLREMMRGVVTEGTGRNAAPSVCTAAGKTGTAETGQIGGENPVVQSWFAGYFPAENPRYVVTVLAEDADNTGGNSATAFCEISNKLWELVGE